MARVVVGCRAEGRGRWWWSGGVAKLECTSAQWRWWCGSRAAVEVERGWRRSGGGAEERRRSGGVEEAEACGDEMMASEQSVSVQTWSDAQTDGSSRYAKQQQQQRSSGDGGWMADGRQGCRTALHQRSLHCISRVERKICSRNRRQQARAGPRRRGKGSAATEKGAAATEEGALVWQRRGWVCGITSRAFIITHTHHCGCIISSSLVPNPAAEGSSSKGGAAGPRRGKGRRGRIEGRQSSGKRNHRRPPSLSIGVVPRSSSGKETHARAKAARGEKAEPCVWMGGAADTARWWCCGRCESSSDSIGSV